MRGVGIYGFVEGLTCAFYLGCENCLTFRLDALVTWLFGDPPQP